VRPHFVIYEGEAQLSRPAFEPYALTNMPGANFLEKGVLSPRHAAYKAAQKDLATARRFVHPIENLPVTCSRR
jgi:hypothetical protein